MVDEIEECSLTLESGERYWVRLLPDNRVVVSLERKGAGAKTVAEGKLEADGHSFEIRHDLSETLVSWVEWTVSVLVKQRKTKLDKATQAIAHGPTKRPRAQPTKKKKD